MAKFDEILTPATNLASRLVSAQLRRQSPVKTGRLKRSIHVRADRQEDVVIFTADYLGYGVYTDLGTGPYATSEEQRGPWNPTPGKGKGGIKPRFWNSIEEAIWESISDIYYKAYEQAVEKSIEDSLNKIK